MILQGKTQKGKNRIRELGNEWMLERTADTVAFAQRNGPWGIMRPIRGKSEDSRWIHLHNDHDFEIVSL